MFLLPLAVSSKHHIKETETDKETERKTRTDKEIETKT